MFYISGRPNPDAILYKFYKTFCNGTLYRIFSERLNEHPEYPNILALSDVLDKHGINNSAYKISVADITLLPTPLIAQMRDSKNRYLFISAVRNTELKVWNGEGPHYSINKDDFEERFTGVILASEAKQLDLFKRISGLYTSVKQYLPKIVIYLLLATSIFFTSGCISLSNRPLLAALFYALGLITSILIVSQGIGLDYTIVTAFCNANKPNCNTLINSNASKIFGWLSWGEVGLFYFTGSFLAILFSKNSSNVLHALSLLNFICLPYTFYSIYYQLRIAKQICILCTTVQVLIWLGFIALFPCFNLKDLKLFLSEILNLAIFFLTPIVLWFLYKPFFAAKRKLTSLEKQLLKLKRDKQLFTNQMHIQPILSTPNEKWSIALGNSEANNILTVVSSPNCAPCARAHQILHKWLAMDLNLQTRIIFSPNASVGDNKNIVKHFMALYNKGSKDVVGEALSNWYSNKYNGDYERFSEDYPADFSELIDDQLEQQIEWCKISEIRGTPTLFLNGKLVPRMYQLQDIQYFLS
jgi:uncharacterized membrane protein/protein-disulfide isomerase